jgi:hypothetical protein
MNRIGEKIDENALNDVSGGNIILTTDIHGKITPDELTNMIKGAQETLEEAKDAVVDSVKSIFN